MPQAEVVGVEGAKHLWVGRAEEVLDLTGSKSQLVNKGLPQDDPRQRQPDIALARRVLKWEPQVPLEEGLTRTIEYFRGRV